LLACPRASADQPPATPRNDFLATNRTFGDFELRLEYRLDCVSDCNAGIQIRTVRVPKSAPTRRIRSICWPTRTAE
jgi:hypothetical protein